MSSLELFADAKLLELEEKNLLRHLKTTESISGIHVKRNGKAMISFASNDYLGLAMHPALKNAAMKAIDKYGTGAGASRYVTGNYPLYNELENKIANFKGFNDALVVGSGYLANIGAIPALVEKGDLILADKLVHACIIDGAKLSGADFKRFKHNDLGHLEDSLKKAKGKYKNALIIIEEIFSMDGDKAPLGKIHMLAKKYGAWVLCDAAHSLYENENYPKENFILMGTFSKALGSYGGYIAGDKNIISYLRNKMRSSIFTTALPPMVIAASIAALDIIKNDSGLAKKALTNAKLFTSMMNLEPAESAIVPYILRFEKKTLDCAGKLEEKGFLVAAIRPPTVAKNSSRLRFSFSAAHTKNDIKKLVKVFKEIIK